MKRLIFLLILTTLMFSCEKNTHPVIESIVAEPDSVYPGDTVTLSFHGYNRDDQVLQSAWSCKSGILINENTSLGLLSQWVAPREPGAYFIKLRIYNLTDETLDSIRVLVMDFPIFDPTSFPIGVSNPALINYVVLTPPVVMNPWMSADEFYINLDTNTSHDLMIYVHEGSSPGGWYYKYSQVYCLNPSVELADGGGYPTRFLKGDLLSPAQNWLPWHFGSSSLQFSPKNGTESSWPNQTGYFCFRKAVKEKYKYGWVKLSIENDKKATIYEWAIMKIWHQSGRN